MENIIFNIMFFMSMLFLYVLFGPDLTIIVILSLIYLKIGFDNA